MLAFAAGIVIAINVIEGTTTHLITNDDIIVSDDTVFRKVECQRILDNSIIMIAKASTFHKNPPIWLHIAFNLPHRIPWLNILFPIRGSTLFL
jgi:hypothetical protein